MIKKCLKYLGVIIIILGIFVLIFIAFLWFCKWSINKERDYFSLEDLPHYCVIDVNKIREITECDAFPDFEATNLWYYKSDSSHTFPHIECYFKKEMSEKEYEKFWQTQRNICWGSDKDATLYFSRGWSKKEYMDIPQGMEENLVITIDKLDNAGFTLSYKRNDGWVKIDKDYINKLTGFVFPPYSVISFENDGDIIRAKLLFSDFVEKKTADALANNSLDSMEIKIDTLINNKWVFFDMLRNEKHAHLFISLKK